MPHFVILVNYTDSHDQTGTARLRMKAASADMARKQAETELTEFEKISTRKNVRRFDLSSIQVVEQADPRKEEGLLISRNNIRSGLEVWELKGTIDPNTNKQFEELLEEAKLEGTTGVILDCKGLEYINSTGIGTIVNMNAEIKLKIANLPQKIAEIFIVIGLDSLLEFYYSIEEALADS